MSFDLIPIDLFERINFEVARLEKEGVPKNRTNIYIPSEIEIKTWYLVLLPEVNSINECFELRFIDDDENERKIQKRIMNDNGCLLSYDTGDGKTFYFRWDDNGEEFAIQCFYMIDGLFGTSYIDNALIEIKKTGRLSREMHECAEIIYNKFCKLKEKNTVNVESYMINRRKFYGIQNQEKCIE